MPEEQSKKLDGVKETKKTSDTTSDAARQDGIINKQENQTAHTEAKANNPGGIEAGVSVVKHLTTLKPGMTKEQAEAKQAELEAKSGKKAESFGIVYEDGRTETAEDGAKKGKDAAKEDRNKTDLTKNDQPKVESVKDGSSDTTSGDTASGDAAKNGTKENGDRKERQKKPVRAENLDSQTLKAMESDGPLAVRQFVESMNSVREGMKKFMPPGEDRDQVDLDLKKSVADFVNNQLTQEQAVKPDPGAVADKPSEPKTAVAQEKVADPQPSSEDHVKPPVTKHDELEQKSKPTMAGEAPEHANKPAAKHEEPEHKNKPAAKHEEPEHKNKPAAKHEEPEHKNKPAAKHEEPEHKHKPAAKHEEHEPKHTEKQKVTDRVKEVEEVKKIGENGPSGKLVYKDANGYHQMQCADGKVYDSHKKAVGEIADDGTLTLKGTSFKIESKDNKGDYMFFGNDSHGSFTKHVPPSSKHLYDGVLTSFDQKTQYSVLGGFIFDKSGTFTGHLDTQGRVERIHGKQATGLALVRDTDVNILFDRFVFDGVQDGHPRRFVSHSDLCTGTMVVPEKYLPKSSGTPVDGNHNAHLSVHSGMIIDKNGKQLGLLQSPNEAAGKLDGGSVVWFGSKTPIPLCDLKDTTFHFKALGETGLKGEPLKGICLGPKQGGKGGFLDVSEAQRASDGLYSSKKEAINDWQHQGLNIGKWVVDEASGQHHKELETAAQKSNVNKALDYIVREGVFNDKSVSDLIKHSNDLVKEWHGDAGKKPGKDPEKRIEIPPLGPATVGKVDGTLILNNSSFEIRKGQLYQCKPDANGHVTVSDKPSGKLLPNYQVELDGNPKISLYHENRVVMKFNIEGDKAHPAPYRVLGTGKNRVASNGVNVEAGLVSVEDLNRKVSKIFREEDLANKLYFKDKNVMDIAVQHAADHFMGGHAESGLRSQQAREQLGLNSMDKSIKKLFDMDPRKAPIENAYIDASVTNMQQVMHVMKIDAAEAQYTRGDLRQAQRTMGEATTMAIITVATMGVGTMVTGAANAGRFATFGKFANAASFATKAGGSALAGGTVRTVAGLHDGQTGNEAARNFAGGSLEGLAMAIPGGAGGADKLQKMSRVMKLAKVAAGEATVVEVAGATAVKTVQSDLIKHGLGRAAGIAGSNLAQSTLYAGSSYFRESAENPNAKITDSVNFNTIALGTGIGIIGHGVHVGVGPESGLMKSANKLLPEFKINAGESMEQFVLHTPSSAISNFASGEMNFLPTGYDKEHNEVAKALGKDPKDVSLLDVLKYGDFNRFHAGASESAAAGALLGIFGSHSIFRAEGVIAQQAEHRVQAKAFEESLIPAAIHHASDVSAIREHIDNTPFKSEMQDHVPFMSWLKSNHYSHTLEAKGHIPDGFVGTTKGGTVDMSGNVSGVRHGIVVDTRHDPLLSAVISDSQHKFGDLPPRVKAAALTEYTKQLLTPANATESEVNSWYSRFIVDNKGKGVELGKFIQEGKGSCAEQAMLLKVLADKNGLDASFISGAAHSDSGLIDHAWTQIKVAPGEELIYDPRMGVYGATNEELIGTHKRGKDVIAEARKVADSVFYLGLHEGQEVYFQGSHDWKVNSYDSQTGHVELKGKQGETWKTTARELYESTPEFAGESAKKITEQIRESLEQHKNEKIAKPFKDAVGQGVADLMNNSFYRNAAEKPAEKRNAAEALTVNMIDAAMKKLDWSPQVVAKVEQYNAVRQQISMLPEQDRHFMYRLLGTVDHEGVSNKARVSIVENMFKHFDPHSDAANAEQMAILAPKLLDALRPMDEDRKRFPDVAKLEQVLPDDAAKIREDDIARERQKPIEISKEKHNELVDGYFEKFVSEAEDGRPAEERILHLVVGPPGAGKSTSIVDKCRDRDHAMVIDSDHIKPQLPGYTAPLRGVDDTGFGAGAGHNASSKIAKEILTKAMGEGYNIVQPILGRTPDGLLETVMEAKAHGYKVAVHIADIPPEVSAVRAHNRAQKAADEHGVRQQVPPTYSLEKVGWDPQITFERLEKHLGDFIELNHCDTNKAYGEHTPLEPRSELRIKDIPYDVWRPRKEITGKFEVTEDSIGLPEVNIAGDKYGFMPCEGWQYLRERFSNKGDGDTKLHVTIKSEDDLRKVQELLIPALTNDPFLSSKVCKWKTEPFSSKADRQYGKEQHAKGFTIYFTEAGLERLDDVQRYLDRVISQNGLGLPEKIATGNIGEIVEKSNRISRVRDTFERSVDTDLRAACVDRPLQKAIEERYGHRLNDEELRGLEGDLHIRLNTLVYDSENRLCVKFKSKSADLKDWLPETRKEILNEQKIYATEGGACKNEKEGYTERWAIYHLYRGFKMDPAFMPHEGKGGV